MASTSLATFSNKRKQSGDRKADSHILAATLSLDFRAQCLEDNPSPLVVIYDLVQA